MKEFKKLDFPRLREYYTKYPQGYTIYESLLDILEHINGMTDTVNLTLSEWKRIESWILTELKNYSIDQLQAWTDDGTLEDVINDVLFNNKADKTELIEIQNILKSEIVNLDLKVAQNAQELKTKTTKQQLSNELVGLADKTYVDGVIKDVRTIIADIITTPVEGISEQEIIDARQGKISLGENIREIKNGVSSFVPNKILNPNFDKTNLDDYSFFFGSGQLSMYVEAIPTQDSVVLTASGAHPFYGTVMWQKLKDTIPTTEKWYIRARMRSWDDGIFDLRVGFRGVSGLTLGGTTDVDNIKIGQWYEVSHMYDPKIHTKEVTNLDGEFRSSISGVYQTAIPNNGKRVEVSDVVCLNVTEIFGYGNEPTKEEMDEFVSYLPNPYFKGNADVSNIQKAMLNYFIKKKGNGGMKKPLAVFTFDDGFESDYLLAYPEFKARGMVGTSYIWTSRTGTYERAMSVEQLKELKLNGWGIECHTHDHLRLNEQTDEEINNQMQLVNTFFTNNGLPLPKHHALPFGSGGNVNRVTNIVKQYRQTIRNISSNSNGIYNTWEDIKFSGLNVVNIDSGTKESLKQAIDLTVENKGILVFMAHEVKTTGAGDYEADLGKLQEILDYAKLKGMLSVTVDEMYKRVLEYQQS